MVSTTEVVKFGVVKGEILDDTGRLCRKCSKTNDDNDKKLDVKRKFDDGYLMQVRWW